MHNRITYSLLYHEHLPTSLITTRTKSRFYITELSHPTDSILHTHFRQNAILGILGDLWRHFGGWRRENMRKRLKFDHEKIFSTFWIKNWITRS